MASLPKVGFKVCLAITGDNHMPTDRDAIPRYAERSQRLGDLTAEPALPLTDVSLFLDVPLSTMDMLRAQGKGPRCFKIGRRLYVTQQGLRDWLERMATEQAA
jgi:hypothetical protein